jgi:hypothetical protein
VAPPAKLAVAIAPVWMYVEDEAPDPNEFTGVTVMVNEVSYTTISMDVVFCPDTIWLLPVMVQL